MADRDAQSIAVHGRHFTGKVRSVIRSSLEHIELPLVNHLMCQRADDLPFSLLGANRIVAVVPPNKNLAPPGYYMLFVVRQGIPSKAKFVQLQ